MTFLPDTLVTPPREDAVDVRGNEVRVLTAGSGDPIVYLHGSGDLGGWLPVHTRIAESFQVIRPDLPGFNRSAANPEISSVHDMSFALLDLFDTLGLDRVGVIGSSLGGWIAADLATIEPTRIQRLVLVDAAGLRPSGGFPVDMFTLSSEQILRKTYHDPEAVERALAAAAARDADEEQFALLLRNRAATAKLGWNPYFHDVKLPGRLHRITAETLVVWGAHDRLMPPELAQAYAERIPRSRIAVIDDAGHLPHLERPEAFLAEVLPFLQP
jgi:pimeloyl-ACP methyl ester carboxylesterase